MASSTVAARSPTHRSSSVPQSTPQSTLFDLERLLARLQETVLSDTRSNPALRTSASLRHKTSANIEYARTLILRLERETTGPGGNKQQRDSGAIKHKIDSGKETIRRLNRRLVELDRLDLAPKQDAEIVKTPSDMTLSTGTLRRQDTAGEQQQQQQLRQRKTETPHHEDETRDKKSEKASSSALFDSTSRSRLSKTTTTTTLSREQVLESERTEQDSIKESLLQLAQRLKSSTQAFGAALEGEKSILNRAESGLDKNALGMEAAERRMGMLRRMTEGQGWYGRIKLFALIAAMWIGAFLLVFVGPKLRF